jgi:hypothetical protein
MAPAPVPSPFVQPFLEHAKSGWDSTSNFMNWFTKLVASAYSWSDLIIKMRQDKANKAYKIQRAEKKALQIMREHQKKLKEQNSTAAAVTKRDYVPFEEDGYAADVDESL